MYIVTRYVVWEVVKFFLAALFVLTLVVTLVFGAKEALNKGYPLLVMLRIIPYMLPEMLQITIPVAMLFSVCSVFGRMTGTNEVVALKSLGVSPMTVVWPALVVAAFVSLITVCLYEIGATWGKANFIRVASESIEEIAYSKLQKDGAFGTSEDPFMAVVSGVRGRKLLKPTITLNPSPGQKRVRITAEEAELSTDRSDPAKPVLWIILTNFEVNYGDGLANMRFPETGRRSIPIVPPPPPLYIRFFLGMRDIPGRIAELQANIRALEAYLPVATALGSKALQDSDQIAEFKFRMYQLMAEPYRRWANGFTCLCFALVGAPVAMLWRHADVLTNFFICFLPILAIYYPLLMFSEDLATSPHWPSASFWLANIAISIPAIWLLRWINRH